MQKWQHYHIFDELSRYGIIINILNPLDYPSGEIANQELLCKLKHERYELFMTPHGHSDIFPETITEIGKLGIPRLLICFDNLVAPYMHRDVCRFFDLIWLTSPENKEMFLKWGANQIIVQPYAANPFIFQGWPSTNVNRCVFIGTPYGSRANLINSITEENLPVTIFGYKGKSDDQKILNPISKLSLIKTALEYSTYPVGRKLIHAAIKQRFLTSSTLDCASSYLELKSAVPIEQLAVLYPSYKLAISSTTARNSGILRNPVEIINLRSFEIPMYGGVQLCRFNKELSEYFESGKEIIFFHDNEDMKDKIRFYLSPRAVNDCKRIRLNARARSVEDHSWYIRFSSVLNILKG